MLHRVGLARPVRGLRLSQSPIVRQARPRNVPGTTVASFRPYANMPSQEQLSRTFTEPTRQFILTLSRIARIIVFTATGVAAVGFFTWEGAHMYVEHSAMAKDQVGSGIFDDHVRQARDGDDSWGWLHDFGEETWVGLNRKGTDPRLGLRARHVLRAAWMSLMWGAGIAPSQYMSSGGIGAPTFGSRGKGSYIPQDGGANGEAFLLITLAAAEKAGIRLPDMAAVRAGLQTLSSPPGRPDKGGVDKTAVMLEYRLAGVRERLGTPTALKGALAGYTRLFDALATVEATNRAMKSADRTSDLPLVSTDRLVRLATRIGELQAIVGNRAEAEGWLLQAVSIAGGGAAADGVELEGARQGLLRNELLAGGTGSLSRTPVEAQEAQATIQSLSASSSSAESADSSNTVRAVEMPPSPSLTRSLIQSLLALSAFYAQPHDRSALEKALKLQASALRLTRVETGRMGLSDKTKSDQDALGAQLHRLWLAQHDGLACVHVGETMYGLQKAKGGLSSVSGMLHAIGIGGNEQGKQDQTIAWLDEARSRADLVTSQLASNANTRRPTEEAVLAKKWQEASVDVRTYAERLLRDATRLRAAVDDMRRILQAKKP